MTTYEALSTAATAALVVVGIVYTRLTYRLAVSAERQIRMQAAGTLNRELREITAFAALLTRILGMLEKLPWIENPKKIEEFADVDFWSNIETKDLERLTVRHFPIFRQRAQEVRRYADWMRRNAQWVQKNIGKPRPSMYPKEFWYYMGMYHPHATEGMKEIQRVVETRRLELVDRATEYKDVMW